MGDIFSEPLSRTASLKYVFKVDSKRPLYELSVALIGLVAVCVLFSFEAGLHGSIKATFNVS